ncbi:hypothetical protein BN439_0282 [Erwinia amylovora Ea644]|nr:hypothetical protein BN439_0282 [Erwinia amylovora Ea644]
MANSLEIFGVRFDALCLSVAEATQSIARRMPELHYPDFIRKFSRSTVVPQGLI